MQGSPCSVRGNATSPPPQGNDAAFNHKDLHWSPPDVDAVLPGISGIVACALPTVLEGAGERAVELFVNLENFTAKERIEYVSQDDHGAIEERDSSVFDYAFGFETRGGGRTSQEYRTVAKGGHALSASGQDTGLVALALICLPSLQSDYDMRCEGVINGAGSLPMWSVSRKEKRSPAGRLVLRGTVAAAAHRSVLGVRDLSHGAEPHVDGLPGVHRRNTGEISAANAALTKSTPRRRTCVCAPPPWRF